MEEMNTQLSELQTMIAQQTDENAQLAELSRTLRQITQHIEQAAATQLQESDAVVQAIDHIRQFVTGSSKMTQLLAQSAVDLGAFETHLVESLGRFLISAHPLPPILIRPVRQ